MPVDYREVIADLRNKAALMGRMADSLEETIFGASKPEAEPVPVKAELKPRDPAPEPVLRAQSARKPTPEFLRETLISVVMRAAAEPTERTQTQLIERVLEFRPEAKRDSIYATIAQQLKQRHLHKDDRMIIRPVVDGKIQYVNPPVSFSIEHEHVARQ